MAYRRQQLAGLGHTLPAPEPGPVAGMRPFVYGPAVEVMRAQDKIAPLSRRVILSSGFRGDQEWRVPNTDPLSVATRTHPDRTTWYVVARGRVEVTPGCFFRLVGACVPSGETQRAGGPTESSHAWWPDGVHGRLRVTVVWTDRSGSTETTIREATLPGSTLEFGSEDTSDGGFWRSMRNFSIEAITPPGVPANTVELHRFSQHVTATITVEAQGSPRIVDLALHELPIAVAFEDDDDGDRWTSHTFTTGSPDAPIAPPTHALARASSTNPTGGAMQILETARAQALRLGPCLFQWSAYSETDAGPTTTIVARTTSNDGSTFENLLNASHTGTGPAAYDASLPGFSVSCGGYARRWSSSNPLVLRDRIAVIPVLVRAYGRGITAGTSTVRAQTARHSYVDLTLPVAGSAAWSSAIGWLEVGISPDQPVIGQVFLNHLGASGSLSVEAMEVYYCASSPVV